MTDQPIGTDTPPHAPPADTKPTSSSSETKRYAVYDKTYQRFVGGVHDTKKAAQDEAKTRKVKSSEIREV